MLHQKCLKAIRTANKLGITVSCDINYRDNLWKYGKTAQEIMPDMVAGSDIILGNEEDCEKVFGIKPQNFNDRTYSRKCRPKHIY